MIKGQPLTAIIPVRGGSKGIPGKNLYRLGKDTLLERSIKLAKTCKYVDRVLVTTDDTEMYAIAKKHNAAAPTLRPAHLATDTASTVDVVLDLIETAAIEGYVLLLQVTSPLRTLADFNTLCKIFDSAKADAIVSVTPHDAPHPDKIQIIEDGFMVPYTGKDPSIARQLLPTVYALNGAFYLTHRNTVMEKRSFTPPHTLPYIMPKERSLNLDGPLDLLLLEAMVEKGKFALEEYD